MHCPSKASVVSSTNANYFDVHRLYFLRVNEVNEGGGITCTELCVCVEGGCDQLGGVPFWQGCCSHTYALIYGRLQEGGGFMQSDSQFLPLVASEEIAPRSGGANRVSSFVLSASLASAVREEGEIESGLQSFSVHKS